MVSSNIKVFLRIRPCARPSKGFSLEPEKNQVCFDVEKYSPDGQVNNSKTNWKFNFDGILPMQSSQEDVFEAVAKPVIEDVLAGINGTIFAYGQTGSGKTFTITGGAERYQDRGLIPRIIGHFFETFKKTPECKFSMYISYLEIYNNDGYDLLSRDEDGATKLEDLPKVILREDEEGNIKLRNLSVNMAQKAEDALNLLFLGDTNRVVAETPMNDASTRSHCMFIIWVESSRPGSDTIRRAKLHLVDLAGSERIGKTGVEGKLQTEAKNINLSLHYLEQVIVALHERTQGRRQHVPYRNSILTSVLRDSLGGNCRTLMVGTIATEDSNLEESISTCKFAQRVAAIKNNAVVNEELDPAMMIRRLKTEVAQLKDELSLMSGGGEEEAELTETDRQECSKLVSAHLAETDAEAPFTCGSAKRFRECFHLLRQVYWQRQADGGLGAGVLAGGDAGVASAAPGSLEATVLELRTQMQQRDQEIGMLLGSLNKRTKGRDTRAVVDDGPVFIRGNRQQQQQQQQLQQASPDASPQLGRSGAAGLAAATPGAEVQAAAPGGGTSQVPAAAGMQAATADSAALLLDRNKAFEVFRKSVRRSDLIEENKEATKKLFEDARAYGETANAARAAMNARKVRVEKMRMERALDSNPRDPNAPSSAAMSDTPEVVALLREMDEQKRAYTQATEKLRHVKSEIDKYKLLKEQNQQRLQRDFESWFRSLEASDGGVALPPDLASGLESQVVAAHGVWAAAGAAAAQSASSSGAPSGGAVDARLPTASSMRSRRSEPDSSARSSPAAGAGHRAVAAGAAAELAAALQVEPGDRPLPGVSAWGPPPELHGHGAQAVAGAAPSAASRPPPARQTTALARPGSQQSAATSTPAAVPAASPPRAPAPPARAASPVPGRAASPARRPAAQAMAPAPAAPAGVAETGDEETDKEIAAYYAALAALT